MKLVSRIQLIGQAVAAVTMVAIPAATVPARAADDLPMVDGADMPPPPSLEYDGPRGEPYPPRPYSQRPYAPNPYAARAPAPGPYAAIPPGRYGRSALDRPVLPPAQVVSVLRSTGYSPLGQVAQRGWIYTVAALDPNGDDGRLIIDARTGRIMRFIPALAVDELLNERMAMAYGPPGPPPVAAVRYDNRRGGLLDLRHAPRPPSAIPKVTQRAAPKVASRAPSGATSVPAAAPAAAAAASPPSQQAAPAQPSATAPPPVAESKAVAATVGAATPAVADIKSAPAEQRPTTELPPVQTLE